MFYVTYQQPLKAQHVEIRILLIGYWSLFRIIMFTSECTPLFLLETCSSLGVSIHPSIQTPRKQGLCRFILNDPPISCPEHSVMLILGLQISL